MTATGAARPGSYPGVLLSPAGHKEGEEEPDDRARLLGRYDAAHSQLTTRVQVWENDLSLGLQPAGAEGIPGRN